MPHRLKISTQKVGLAPGHAVFTGEQRLDTAKITWMRFKADSVSRGDAATVADIPLPDPKSADVLWINMDGLHDVDLVKAVGERFELHPLAIEDVVSMGGRPVAEAYDAHVFTTLKMLMLSAEGSVVSNHTSIVFGPGWVLSFQETAGDVFGNLRRRIADSTARVRSRGADYLWYALLDAIVDHYALVLSRLGSRIEELEEEVWGEEPGRDLPLRAQEARHQLLVVRRAVRPLREQLALLTGDCPALITTQTEPFLSDLETHLAHHNDSIDHLRDVITSLLEAHVSIMTMRANEVMRVLTVVASIFIPMTFVASVYGMNFQFMPELAHPWGYEITWAVMLGVGISMLLYFWRKRWL
ncbi:MAG: magnesium/cobalt transporter CorA [Gemmatimonadetes bacterium]|nr:magnesium/cobalt transporter CorA [Gemmatimonadota bacterium]